VADNQSQYNGSETVYYEWISSDGTNFFNKLYQHSFRESGKYKIKLIGSTSEGCADSTEKLVEVYPQGKSKVIILDTIQCLRGNRFNFGNESRVDGSRFAILRWNFGNGYIDTIYTTSPVVFEYGDTGTFKVELITTTENLCTDTSFGFVRVVEMPNAELLQNSVSACFNQQAFEFYDVSNRILGYNNEWIFDKQTVRKQDTLFPQFSKPGKYRVSLVAKTKFGCSDTASRWAVVNDVPQARIAVNTNEQCLAKNDFLFTNVSRSFSNPDEFWDFGDGSIGTGSEINQSYTDPGFYLVELIVENDSLCADTANMTVNVNPMPEAALSIPPVCVNQPSLIESNAYIETGEIVNYQWNLGDGGNSVDTIPNQTYKRPGKYYVRLEMTSDKGCFSKFLDSTEVYPNPVSYFTDETQRATILAPEVYLVDSSTDGVTYEWDMNDGSDFYSDYEVKHNYSDTGIYRVRLVVASAEGCLDTSYKEVRVWPDYNILLPTAFSPNDDEINDEYHIRGNHHSVRSARWTVYNSDGIMVFESQNINESWNGTRFNSSEELPSGEYQIILLVTDVYGKQAQFNQKVTIVR
jgi:gliding motility-associated-like protein